MWTIPRVIVAIASLLGVIITFLVRSYDRDVDYYVPAAGAAIPARPTRPAVIAISNRNLSLRFKVWQRTVAGGSRG